MTDIERLAMHFTALAAGQTQALLALLDAIEDTIDPDREGLREDFIAQLRSRASSGTPVDQVLKDLAERVAFEADAHKGRDRPRTS